MKMILEFSIPEEEAEARAAMDSMEQVGAMLEFRERLRAIAKYELSVGMEELYREYCALVERFL